jgi:uncharacterized protein
MSEVSDNVAHSRYEMSVDGSVAYVTYALDGDRITLIHTQVPEALGGRGIGSTLARSVLEDIRRRRLHVVPECPFIASYIERHPAFADLVAASDS